jgi:hypothetical protein
LGIGADTVWRDHGFLEQSRIVVVKWL